MKTDKYYTPKIKEFHVGFEFEFQGIDNNWNKTGWNKHIVSTDADRDGEWIPNLELIQHVYNGDEGIIDKETFRVKYLDELDIKSLGGFIDKNEMWNMGHGMWLTYHAQTESIYEITDGKDYESQVYFYGVIKNKSKLKEILEMTGILALVET